MIKASKFQFDMNIQFHFHDDLCGELAEDIEKHRNKNNSGGMNNLAMFLCSHEGRVCTPLLQHNDQ